MVNSFESEIVIKRKIQLEQERHDGLANSLAECMKKMTFYEERALQDPNDFGVSTKLKKEKEDYDRKCEELEKVELNLKYYQIQLNYSNLNDELDSLKKENLIFQDNQINLNSTVEELCSAKAELATQNSNLTKKYKDLKQHAEEAFKAKQNELQNSKDEFERVHNELQSFKDEFESQKNKSAEHYIEFSNRNDVQKFLIYTLAGLLFVAALFLAYQQYKLGKLQSESSIEVRTQNVDSTSEPLDNVSKIANTITQDEALHYLESWLEKRKKIYSNPYDEKLLGQLTTDIFYADALAEMKALKAKNMGYEYTNHSLSLVNMVASDKTIVLVVKIEGQFKESGKSLFMKVEGEWAYVLVKEENKWKISNRYFKK
jgi:hypothetical protein